MKKCYSASLCALPSKAQQRRAQKKNFAGDKGGFFKIV
jgi:hypothetical protein